MSNVLFPFVAFVYSWKWQKEQIDEFASSFVLKRLRDAVRRKRPRFWSSGDWLLHHDNAPAHSSNLLQQFLAKHNIVQLRYPPYSPDIVMRCASWRPFQNLRSRTALRCGSTAGSVWFNQMGTTSKDATVRMTKNSTNAEIWTQVGYFSDTHRVAHSGDCYFYKYLLQFEAKMFRQYDKHKCILKMVSQWKMIWNIFLAVNIEKLNFLKMEIFKTMLIVKHVPLGKN